jgi:hypothetical protein
MHPDVICLHFILATKYEEIVAISWNPAEGKVNTIKCLDVLTLIITSASRTRNKNWGPENIAKYLLLALNTIG